jgi:hypothetical protein
MLARSTADSDSNAAVPGLGMVGSNQSRHRHDQGLRCPFGPRGTYQPSAALIQTTNARPGCGHAIHPGNLEAGALDLARGPATCSNSRKSDYDSKDCCRREALLVQEAV